MLLLKILYVNNPINSLKIAISKNYADVNNNNKKNDFNRKIS